MCINFSAVKIFAENDVTDILFLGDSIAYGYGLADGEKTYCKIIQDYYGSKVSTVNLAVNGYTTSDLLALVNNEENTDEIKKADVICISIGGNDILDVFISAMLDTLSSADENSDITSSVKGLLTNPEKLSEFTKKLEAGTISATGNLPKILDALKKKNSHARIIFQTIYNPFETTQDNPNLVFIKALYTLMQNYGGKINISIFSLKNTETADIHALLAGSGWLTTNIDDYDIHPNQLGHIAIASEIISLLSNGKKTTAEVMPKLTKSVLSKEKFNSYLSMAESASDSDLVKFNPIVLKSLGITPPSVTTVTTAEPTSAAASLSSQITTAMTTVSDDTAQAAVITVITDNTTQPETTTATVKSETTPTEAAALPPASSTVSETELAVKNPELTKGYTQYYFFASIAVLALIAALGFVKKFKK